MLKQKKVEDISFRKPDNFVPVFAASINEHKKRIIIPFVLTGLLLLGTISSLITSHYFEFIFGVSLLGISPFFLIPAIRVYKNGTLLEISNDGIWINAYKLYIPKNIFLNIENIWNTHHDQFTEHKTRHITLNIATPKHTKRSLVSKGIIYSTIKENTDNEASISFRLPFASGKIENIGLNITRAELFQVLNNFKKGEGLFEDDKG